MSEQEPSHPDPLPPPIPLQDLLPIPWNTYTGPHPPSFPYPIYTKSHFTKTGYKILLTNLQQVYYTELTNTEFIRVIENENPGLDVNSQLELVIKNLERLFPLAEWDIKDHVNEVITLKTIRTPSSPFIHTFTLHPHSLSQSIVFWHYIHPLQQSLFTTSTQLTTLYALLHAKDQHYKELMTELSLKGVLKSDLKLRPSRIAMLNGGVVERFVESVFDVGEFEGAEGWIPDDGIAGLLSTGRIVSDEVETETPGLLVYEDRDVDARVRNERGRIARMRFLEASERVMGVLERKKEEVFLERDEDEEEEDEEMVVGNARVELDEDSVELLGREESVVSEILEPLRHQPLEQQEPVPNPAPSSHVTEVLKRKKQIEEYKQRNKKVRKLL